MQDEKFARWKALDATLKAQIRELVLLTLSSTVRLCSLNTTGIFLALSLFVSRTNVSVLESSRYRPVDLPPNLLPRYLCEAASVV